MLQQVNTAHIHTPSSHFAIQREGRNENVWN